MAEIGENRNVFISWSGARSKAFAEALRDWLPQLISTARPWISTRDLEKGTQWQAEITGQLQASNIGIFCLTPENLKEPWILFEAGSLSKGLGANRVFTYLFEMEHKDVEPPLSVFNHTKADKPDTLRLVQDINRAVAGPLTQEQVRILFEALWPKLEIDFQAVPRPRSAPPPQRSSESMFSEILDAVRQRGDPQPSDFQADVLTRLTMLEQGVRPVARTPGQELVRLVMADGRTLSLGADAILMVDSDEILGTMPPALAAEVLKLGRLPNLIFKHQLYSIEKVRSNGMFEATLIPRNAPAEKE